MRLIEDGGGGAISLGRHGVKSGVRPMNNVEMRWIGDRMKIVLWML